VSKRSYSLISPNANIKIGRIEASRCGEGIGVTHNLIECHQHFAGCFARIGNCKLDEKLGYESKAGVTHRFLYDLAQTASFILPFSERESPLRPSRTDVLEDTSQLRQLDPLDGATGRIYAVICDIPQLWGLSWCGRIVARRERRRRRNHPYREEP